MKGYVVYIMAAVYILAGVLHFIKPRAYLSIMPKYLPLPLLLVYVSGIFEAVPGVMLLFPQTRVAGAWLLIATLIVIFPANIQMAVDFYNRHNPYLLLALLRLPLQGLLIWWAWLYTRS